MSVAFTADTIPGADSSCLPCLVWMFGLFVHSLRSFRKLDDQCTVWNSINHNHWLEIMSRGAMNTRPDRTHQVIGVQNRSKIPTRLSVEVLISRLTIYSIFNVPFSLWSQCLWGEQVLKIPSNKTEILRSLAHPYWVNPTRTRSWIQLVDPIPDPTQTSNVCFTPNNEGTG